MRCGVPSLLLRLLQRSKAQSTGQGPGARASQHPWTKLGPRGATPFSSPTLGFESHAWDFLWAQRLASWARKGTRQQGVSSLLPDEQHEPGRHQRRGTEHGNQNPTQWLSEKEDKGQFLSDSVRTFPTRRPQTR